MNSLLFGLLCLALTEWIHPFISGIVFKIPLLPLYILSGCVFALLMLDTTLSVVSVLKLSGRLEKLHILQQQLSEKLKETVEEGEKRSLEFMEELEGLKEKILSTQLNTKYYEARILRAFPQLESYKDRDLANELRKKLNEQKQKFKELKDSLNKK